MVDTKDVTVNKQNGNLADEILTSACVTQALGVTAGLVGCIYLLKTRPADYSETNNFIILFSPIFVAYVICGLFLSIWLISSNINGKDWEPRFALKCIYYSFILPDIVLLALLVFITGGPRENIFLPIFLLIPAIATCYCNPKPKNGYFWAAIAIVIFTFGILIFAEAMGYNECVKEFMDYISNANQMQSTSKPSQSTVEVMVWSSVVSIVCIVTAAFCYYLTDKVRKKPRGEKDCHPETCKSFYL